ncbi:MAG: outer spore coat protein CotE [Bacilli bacterium]|nr:outer spore coat protein CotE [Bacilli bacterium]
MSSYKEIVTKAIIGKGKKYFKDGYSLDVENEPSTILGCWVINHKFNGYKTGDKIGVNGSYDVNIWYSYDNDSKTTVVNKQITYNDIFNVKMKDDANLKDDTDIIVRPLKQPVCIEVHNDNKKIMFDIEKEMGVEIVGETKVKIAIEDDEDTWDEIDDELNNQVEKEIDDNIEEEYIK